MRSNQLNTLVFSVLPIASTRNLCAYETMDHSPLRPKFFRFIFAFFAALLVCSCTHKELCYTHPHISNVQVDFNWSEEPSTYPKSMSVYFFKEGSDAEPLRFEFTEPTGGRIRLTPGVYHAVSVNSDERNHTHQDIYEYDSFCVTTKDASTVAGLSKFGVTPKDLPKAKSAVQERMVLEPNNVWYANARDIFVPDGEDHTMTLDFKSHLVTYNILVRNAANLKWVYGISASMSGLAGGIHIGSGELSDERVTIPFEARWNRDDSTVSGSFTSFGHCPGDKNKHYLQIYAVLADDSYWDFTYDVTDQVHNAPAGNVITIELDGLPIPKPVANGGGFKPTVGDWNSVEIELTM